MLALDGLQPDGGHEVLWVLRDCLAGVVLARAQLALSDPRGLGNPPHGGAPVLTGADRGGPLRWSTLSPPRRGPGLTQDPTPTVSLACSPRGRKAHLCS